MESAVRKFLALALLMLAMPALAQTALPDTPAGHAAQDWLTAFNTGDRAIIAAMNAKYHRDNPVDRALGLYNDTGGLTFMRAESSEPGKLVALMAAKNSDNLLKSTFTVDPANITAGLQVSHEGAQRPPDLAIPRLTQTAVNAATDAKTEAMAKEDKLSGAMLAERNGKIVYKRLWGLANRESGAPITDKTKFRLGSMNKMFTAVAALQLVSQGKLALDGTVGQYLPDYPNQDIAAKVTVRMLLTHSGGTGDFFGPEFDKNRATLKNNEDYVKLFGARGPAFEPGSQERYSNYGFILLGHIVQTVSGENYYTYVDRHIFAPAGMRDSGSLSEDVAVPDRTNGYTFKDGKWLSNADTLPWRGMAAGGGYSTLGDLVKFAHALESGKLLPTPLLGQATTSQTKGQWYGFGFTVGGEGGARWYGHGGGAPGMNGELKIFPASHAIVVALSNLDPPAATAPADFYANRMPLN
jgi:CubicO group peptidase (beta-lactamase class C family)